MKLTLLELWIASAPNPPPQNHKQTSRDKKIGRIFSLFKIVHRRWFTSWNGSSRWFAMIKHYRMRWRKYFFLSFGNKDIETHYGSHRQAWTFVGIPTLSMVRWIVGKNGFENVWSGKVYFYWFKVFKRTIFITSKCLKGLQSASYHLFA